MECIRTVFTVDGRLSFSIHQCRHFGKQFVWNFRVSSCHFDAVLFQRRSMGCLPVLLNILVDCDCLLSHFLPVAQNCLLPLLQKKAARAREQKSRALLNSSDASAESQKLALGEGETEQRLSLKTYAAIAKEAWHPLFDVFLVFFVTLALFPAVLVKIRRDPMEDAQEDSMISPDLFLQLSVFLNFNVFATLGNFIANFIQWPSPKYLSYAVVPRLVFIPLFLFCNYVPPTTVPTPSSLPISGSLSMMYAPKAVEEAKSRIVGMMSAFFLILGITFGILFTFVESYLFSVY
uniref:Equilibrative nucleoside transporter 1 n=1 Tax=Ditylenchus dipsaci TaxID=166011 RepID=A0A915DD29_9BILA